MSEDEIIKVLECIRNTIELDEQPLMSVQLVTDILDLINRQKAEIKRLDKKADKLYVQNCRLCRHNGVLQDRINELKKAKSEAIKEFAERLKKRAYMNNYCVYVVTNEEIDNLVKEMGVNENVF